MIRFKFLVLIIMIPIHGFCATLNVPSGYTTIQAAIDASQSGDVIRVADGIYTGLNNKNLDFAGKGLTIISENGPQNCIIDCQGDGRGFSRVNSSSTISGFTVQNGFASRGGAIYGGGTSPTISNCILKNNNGESLGGAIYSQGNPTITDCVIEGNTAGQGAGMYFTDSSPVITNCIIRNNFTSGNSYQKDGGGLHFGYWYTSPVISNCLIANNSSEGNGGGIYLEYLTAHPQIINCTIVGNTAVSGGGVYCHSDEVVLKNSILWGNAPSEIFVHATTLTDISYCLIQGEFSNDSNFYSNPEFEDADNENYELMDSSPCLDYGTEDGAPDTDINGISRPQGNGFDLGAFERTVTVNRPIIVSYTVSTDQGMVPLTVSFTVISHAGESTASIASYHMDFGDGSPTETNATGLFDHTYNDIGLFYANCRISDTLGNIATTKTIAMNVAGTLRVPSEYATIQEAVDVSTNGSTILVADGDYSGSGNTNVTLTEKSITLMSENGPDHCTIDCQDSGNAFVLENGGSSTIEGFTFVNGNDRDGGAINIMYSDLYINTCVFRDNKGIAGGGIYANNSSGSINGCVFIQNETLAAGAAPYDRAGGGGVCIKGSSNFTISQCVFTENSSYYAGGAVYAQGEATIVNCIFDKNSARSGGGGICSYGMGLSTVTNCTFYQNSSSDTYYQGGAILAGSDDQIKNCIVWANSPDDINSSGLFPQVSYCNISSAVDGEHNFSADPVFVDAENGDFTLMPNSPCIFAGTGDGAPAVDIEDVSRPQGYGVDMGAYERINELERPIINSFAADVTEAHVPFDVTFTCDAYDPNDSSLTYTIDFGDGSSPATNDTGIFTYTYENVGPCYAVCVVTNAEGASVNSLPFYVLKHGNIRVPADYPTIQEAIDASFDTDTILIADGVYTGEGNYYISVYRKTLTIRSENGPENCIIDAGNQGRGFYIRGPLEGAFQLSGLTIKNGSTRSGGGLYISACSATVSDCIFTGNTASEEGGGIYCYYAPEVTLTGCTLSGNTSVTGGGIYSRYSNIVMTDCILDHNVASNLAGGIYMTGDYSDNDSSLIADGCSFIGNTSSSSGGGAYFSRTGLMLNACIFQDNASENGGGIYLSQLRNASMSLTNSVFSGNQSDAQGAALFCDDLNTIDDFARITNCTFTRNVAGTSGGAVYSQSRVPLEITNSILWQDSPNEITFEENEAIPRVSFCTIQNGFIGEGNFHGDPHFVDPDGNDFNVSVESPCINNGTADNAPGEDIEGNERPYGSNYDIGAYEVTSIDGRADIESFDFTVTRNESVEFVFTCIATQADDQQSVVYTIYYGDGTSETNTTGIFERAFSTLETLYVQVEVVTGEGLKTLTKPVQIGQFYVPRDFLTLQDALDAVHNHSDIVLNDGIYNVNVTLDKPVRITSESWIEYGDNTTAHLVADNDDKNIVSIQAEGITLEGLTLYGTANENRAAIYIENTSTDCTIANNRIGIDESDNNSQGIIVDGAANNVITQNTIVFNSGAGIVLSYADNNNLTENRCSNNPIGIALIHSDQNILRENRCNENTTGIGGAYTTENELSENTTDMNDLYGIYLIDSTSDTLHNNRCNENTLGIILETGHFNSLIDNRCNLNRESGILMEDTIDAEANSNTCSNNTIGIALDNAITSQLDDNTCSGNEVGIFVLNSEETSICNNILSDNIIEDLELEPDDKSTIQDCVVTPEGKSSSGGCFIDSVY